MVQKLRNGLKSRDEGTAPSCTMENKRSGAVASTSSAVRRELRRDFTAALTEALGFVFPKAWNMTKPIFSRSF